MNDEIRDLFLELKVIGQRSAISPEDKREKELFLILKMSVFVIGTFLIIMRYLGMGIPYAKITRIFISML